MKKLIIAAILAVLFLGYECLALAYDMGMSHVIMDSRIYTDGTLIFIDIDGNLWVHE